LDQPLLRRGPEVSVIIPTFNNTLTYGDER
jgi:hypothetical protein